MAYSTRFGANILTAAQRLHDNRTVAESSGDGASRYTSDLLRRYQNTAIKDIIRDEVDNWRDLKAKNIKVKKVSEK